VWKRGGILGEYSYGNDMETIELFHSKSLQGNVVEEEISFLKHQGQWQMQRHLDSPDHYTGQPIALYLRRRT